MTERMPSRQTGDRTGSRPSAAEGGGASRASLEAGRSPIYLSAQLLLIEAGRRGVIKMICPTGIAKYFFAQDWTTQITLNRLSKLDFSRVRIRQVANETRSSRFTSLHFSPSSGTRDRHFVRPPGSIGSGELFVTIARRFS
jgi:hypothetical protein